MKREILFKGKRIDNGDWVYGYYLVQNGRGVNGAKDSEIHQIYDTHGTQIVIPESVCQFTGLLDKNGAKIFEGDIVFNSNKTLLTLPKDPRTYVCKWVDGKYNDQNSWLKTKPQFLFKKIQPNGKNYMELIFNRDQIEIIGNIHDNPELLK